MGPLPLGDWYANAALANGKPYIVVVSSVTRLAVVVDALPYASFLTRLPGAIHQTLLEVGISKPRAITICKGMQEMRLGRAFDRSILSTLSDYKIQLGQWVNQQSSHSYLPLQIAGHLNSLRMQTLGGSTPGIATMKALGENIPKNTCV